MRATAPTAPWGMAGTGHDGDGLGVTTGAGLGVTTGAGEGLEAMAGAGEGPGVTMGAGVGLGVTTGAGEGLGVMTGAGDGLGLTKIVPTPMSNTCNQTAVTPAARRGDNASSAFLPTQSCWNTQYL